MRKSTVLLINFILILALALFLPGVLKTVTARFDPQAPTKVNAPLAGYFISGKVVDNTGNPLAGIHLQACLPADCPTPRLHLPLVQRSNSRFNRGLQKLARPSQNATARLGAAGGVYTAITNAGGAYTFTNLLTGGYIVAVIGRPLTLTVSVPPNATAQDFTCAICSPPAPGDMLPIPAGAFQMGCSPNDANCSEAERPLHTVTLSAYSIDKYEVTNARYAACVAAGGCTAPSNASSSTRSSYYGNPTYDNYPVVYMGWSQAAAFCAWEGKRLPSEAEWEKAARGASDTRIYPWGDQAPDCTRANYSYFDGNSSQLCIGDTSAVGSYPAGASPYGVMDMAGNVLEWVNDWYESGYYSVSPTTDPPGPASGAYYHVLRGGLWQLSPDWMRISNRVSLVWPEWNNAVGFRCARSQASLPTPTPTSTAASAPTPTSTFIPTPTSTFMSTPTATPTTTPTPPPTVTSTPPPTATSTPPPTATSTPPPTATPEMATIPIPSSFQMGCSLNDKNCYNDEKPLHAVGLVNYTLSIDKYEVTNARYAACVAAGSCAAPWTIGSHTHSFYYGNPTYSDYPVIYVDWYRAETFCKWEGKRLPTEAEWELAARGAVDTRIYPWGDGDPTCALANFDISISGDGSGRCVDDTSAVGSYPGGVSLFGVMDMAGNVSEWVEDLYDAGYYSVSPPFNPPGPLTGPNRVLRGGSWYGPWYVARTSTRTGLDPTSLNLEIGFRCAR